MRSRFTVPGTAAHSPAAAACGRADLANRSPAPRAIAGLAALASALVLSATAGATIITVTSTADDTTNNGNCTLREAFIAANTNVARDACPAGSANGSDQIVLADGAVYSLTIPNTGGDTGPLIVTNGSATSDVLLRVVNDGEATISQDATPDTRVLVVSAGARFDAQDVVFTGGFAASGDGGGAGILAGAGSFVGLTRCTLRDNVAADFGGGIRTLGGTIAAIDTAFVNNAAGSSGGGLDTTGTAPVANLLRCRFQANSAGGTFGGGGGISIAGQLSVVDSLFIDNRSAGAGGAVVFFDTNAGASSVVNSCFVGNQGKFDGKGVHVFSGSVPLNAGNNWWGASNGPSGAGPGAGDGVSANVDFSFKQTSPASVCLPFPLVANAGFETDVDADGIPDRWSPGNLAATDTLRCGDTGCKMRIFGNGANKNLQQVVPVQGTAGDVLKLRAKADALDVPSGSGSFRVVFTIVFADNTKQDVVAAFSTGTHAFETFSTSVGAAKDYKRIVARVEYGKPSGRARFDVVSVNRAP